MSQLFPQKFLHFFSKFFNTLSQRLKRFKADSLYKKRVAIDKKIINNVLHKKRFPTFSQIKYIKHFLNKSEKIAIILFSILIVISFTGLISLLYLNNTSLVPASGGEYIEGIVGYTRFINPLYSQTNESDKDLVELIFSGLTRRDLRGNIVLDLASDYKVSDDEKTYIFTLKKDIFWHDGKPLLADDIVFTINTIKNEKYNSMLRDSWNNIDVQKIDDYTIRFNLEEVYSSFLSLASVKILPKHIWENVPVASINLAEANTKPIGSGPYKFKSFTKDKVGVIHSYKLEKNNNYYGNLPNINIVIFKFYPDYVSAVNALDNRQIDALAFVPYEARSLLKLKSRFNAYELYLPQYDALFINSAKNELLKDKSIRLAIAMSIDREKIIKEVLGGDGVIVDSPVLSGYLTYDFLRDGIQYDPEGAKNILVDLGWVLRDGNAIRQKDENLLKISITTLDKRQNVNALKIIKKNLENVGIELEINVVSTSKISSEIINKRNYEMLFFGEMLGPELDLYPYWHSSALKYPGLNLAQYSNRQTDSLLEQARKINDRVLRQEKYKEFASLLKEDYPTIFLWQSKYIYLIDKKIKGVQTDFIVAPSLRFNYITSAYINTKRVLK